MDDTKEKIDNIVGELSVRLYYRSNNQLLILVKALMKQL